MEEIEYKYLVQPKQKKNFLEKVTKIIDIEQIYIDYIENNSLVTRIRKSELIYDIHNIKKLASIDHIYNIKKGYGFKREEQEILINKEIYDKISELKIGNIINKTRFIYDKYFEVDFYKNSDIIVCEVEMHKDQVDLYNEQNIPDWILKKLSSDFIILRELTNDLSWSNFSIAINGFPIF